MIRLFDLDPLGATPASNDRIPVVDVSDPTQSPDGSTKYVTYAELTAGLGGGSGGPADNEWWIDSSGNATGGSGRIYDNVKNWETHAGGLNSMSDGDTLKVFTTNDNSTVGSPATINKAISVVGGLSTPISLEADFTMGGGVSGFFLTSSIIDNTGPGLIKVSDCVSDAGTFFTNSGGSVSVVEGGIHFGPTVTNTSGQMITSGGLFLDCAFVAGAVIIHVGGAFVITGGGCTWTGTNEARFSSGAGVSDGRTLNGGTLQMNFDNGSFATMEFDHQGNVSLNVGRFEAATFGPNYVGTLEQTFAKVDGIADNSGGGLTITDSIMAKNGTLGVGIDATEAVLSNLETLRVQGSVGWSIETRNAAFVPDSFGFHYVCDGAAYNITLPPLSTLRDGRMYCFTNNSGAAKTILPNVGDTVAGGASYILAAPGDKVMIQALTGNNDWLIISST